MTHPWRTPGVSSLLSPPPPTKENKLGKLVISIFEFKFNKLKQ